MTFKLSIHVFNMPLIVSNKACVQNISNSSERNTCSRCLENLLHLFYGFNLQATWYLKNFIVIVNVRNFNHSFIKSLVSLPPHNVVSWLFKRFNVFNSSKSLVSSHIWNNSEYVWNYHFRCTNNIHNWNSHSENIWNHHSGIKQYSHKLFIFY